MIASQDSKELGRFVVELTQDVPAMDRSVALPKGTLLITELTNLEKQTHLMNQSAVAIVYKDHLGQPQQQQIPAESLLVRGREGEPLLATSRACFNTITTRQSRLESAWHGRSQPFSHSE